MTLKHNIIKICSLVLNKSTTASRYDLLSLMTTYPLSF